MTDNTLVVADKNNPNKTAEIRYSNLGNPVEPDGTVRSWTTLRKAPSIRQNNTSRRDTISFSASPSGGKDPNPESGQEIRRIDRKPYPKKQTHGYQVHFASGGLERRTILYGDGEVPVIERRWKSLLAPYWTHELKEGQHWWKDLPKEPGRFTQYYVTFEKITEPSDPRFGNAVIVYPGDRQIGVEYIPAEVAIARELKSEGADFVVWSDVWCGKRVLAGPDLVCVGEVEPIRSLLNQLRVTTGRRLIGGLPDVIAFFPDGRVAMREVKYVSNRYKDRLSHTQHVFANAARDLLGDRLGLAVVKWGTLPG